VPMESDVLSLLLKGGVASAVYIGFLSLSEWDEYRRNLQIIYNLIKSQ
jgi:hypothetical protein